MTTEVENAMTLRGNRAPVTGQATQNESDPALGVRRPEIIVPLHWLPVTDVTVLELYEYFFVPWAKMLGLRDLKVCPGIVSAAFPKNDALKLSQAARYVVRQLWQQLTPSHRCLWARRGASLKAPCISTFPRPALNDDYHYSIALWQSVGLHGNPSFVLRERWLHTPT